MQSRRTILQYNNVCDSRGKTRTGVYYAEVIRNVRLQYYKLLLLVSWRPCIASLARYEFLWRSHRVTRYRQYQTRNGDISARDSAERYSQHTRAWAFIVQKYPPPGDDRAENKTNYTVVTALFFVYDYCFRNQSNMQIHNLYRYCDIARVACPTMIRRTREVRTAYARVKLHYASIDWRL